MFPVHCLDSLRRFPNILTSTIEGLADEVWRFQPDSEHWSILEIVCHLRDEEDEDFGARLRSVLQDPNRPWPKIDPPAVAIERQYRQQDPADVLPQFLEARQRSLQWLDSLQQVPWDQSYQHPTVGPVPAGLLLASWAAHDLLHLRQITKRLFQYNSQISPYPVDYAGSWEES